VTATRMTPRMPSARASRPAALMETPRDE
jgi:hypothetical protein